MANKCVKINKTAKEEVSFEYFVEICMKDS